jgi:NADPH-dependent ferric siderophore reductase
MVRVVLGGPGLRDFEANGFADQYVKLVLGRPEAERPVRRTVTVRAWDQAAHELTLDLVVHDEGLAGPWARDARPGDQVLIAGPGGGYSPDPAADWHLLIGDESALPAVAVAAERLPAGSVARVFLEVEGSADEVPLVAPTSAQVTWLHRAGSPRGERLAEAVTSSTFPPGLPQVFLHGEAGVVRTLRRHLLADRQLPRDHAVSVSGYWRLGRDDETWRAEKPVWKRELEADVPAV